MKKLLVVVDMQNDFVTGALGSEMARSIVPKVCEAVETADEEANTDVVYTMDTHDENYLSTLEGKKLPVPHCIEGTWGWELIAELREFATENLRFRKPTFGSLELAQHALKGGYDEIALCGLCTDICVVSNALLIRAHLPNTPISVDMLATAGVTKESYEAALIVMRANHIDVA